ncbi:HemK2/MTQ2 family protein methyltransferase [Nocardia transvalensis]|uniref:HemK2/MTQ2 family protein methyltransferase n=1 Tax=Nocardia transvalensis TaxID=37333 RepID=UPI001892D736|nr:HemK2/MTQ2 family protein methyltransferase [Nocardia transvalensis]MBF6329625.1 methyltransferase [Nocardia transvalensis]
MIIFRPPGVYRPQTDTNLLVRALRSAAIPRDGSVLDICTGTGAVAIHAARTGARQVTAIDVSAAALASARVNSLLRGVRLELLRGDFAEVLGERSFDVVLANPPYVPSPHGLPVSGPARAWDAGIDGRIVLDRLCLMLPRLLNPRGVALVVHSEVCDPDLTLNLLRAGGLKAAVVARATVPFGPVMTERAPWLEEAGLIEPGRRDEELVVVRADRTQA